MSAVTLLLLRLFTGLGVILLLSGCGMIFVYWREDWKLRLTGFICGLVGLFMVVGFEMKLFAYEQSVELIRASRILEGRSNFAGALMLFGGMGVFSKVKFLEKWKILRVLCGVVAVIGLLLFIYYTVLSIRLYL
ncbi:MAG: hypothetical protein HFF83_05880 [Oscillibacter sp.]|nr:hypothetical protein [Oscillibacter sp.]